MIASRSKYFRHEDKDKGYAWVCLLSAFSLATLETGTFAVHGVFFVEFIEYFSVTKAETAVIGSLCVGGSGLSGVILGVFVSRFGLRSVVMFGSVASSFGIAMSCFAPNIQYLYVFMGIFTGIGNGCYIMGFFMGVMLYFEKRRTFAFGIQTLGFSVGAFAFPIMAEVLIKQYSWKGAMLILAGIQLNGVVFGALYRPVEPPDKTEIKTDTEKQSLGRKIKTILYKMVDPSLLKEPRLLLHFISISLVCAGNLIPYMFLPARAVSFGEPKGKAAFLVSIVGFAAGIARVIFGFIGDIIKIYKILGMAIAAILSGLWYGALTFFNVYSTLVAFAVIQGVISSVYTVYLQAILGDLTPPEKIPQATGVAMLIFGVGALSALPIAGAFVDATGSFASPFIAFGFVLIVGGVISFFTFALQKRHLKRGTEITNENEADEIITLA